MYHIYTLFSGEEDRYWKYVETLVEDSEWFVFEGIRGGAREEYDIYGDMAVDDIQVYSVQSWSYCRPGGNYETVLYLM